MTINTTVPGHESHRESTREYRGRQAPTTVTVSSQPLAIVRLIGRGERQSMGVRSNRLLSSGAAYATVKFDPLAVSPQPYLWSKV